MERFKQILITIIFIAFFIFVMTLPGCKVIERVEYVTKTDTVVLVDHKIDSAYVKDSVYVFASNETLYVYKEKVLYRDKIITDTLKTIKYEEIPVDVERVVEVERKFKWFEKFFICFGLISLLSLLGFVFYKFKS